MIIVAIMLVALILLSAITLARQIFKLTELDARCRGFKYPKFWGFFSMTGSNKSGGLILYLIIRRKYPITITDAERQLMNGYKKRAQVTLCCFAVASIGLFAVCLGSGIF